MRVEDVQPEFNQGKVREQEITESFVVLAVKKGS